MLKFLRTISYLLVLVGALNWGLISFFDINLVTILFGEFSLTSKIIYMLVGISAIIFPISERVYERTHCYND